MPESISLSFHRYRFHCRARDAVAFPHYSGSTWRGAFGHALKRTACVTHQPQCRSCLLRYQCAYSVIFETPPPSDAKLLRNYPAAPHPYLIHPEATHNGSFRAGDGFSVELTLIGQANRLLPYLLHSWQLMGEQGLGRPRGRFEVESVSQYDGHQWHPIYRPGAALTVQPGEIPLPHLPTTALCQIQLLTPMRLRYQERLMGAREFNFRGLLANLLRRLSMLAYFHGDTPLEADFKALVEGAGQVAPLDSRLHWFDWTRYSSSQRGTMKMGGLLGNLVFRTADLAPFWPWLSLGQWLHAGKGTVMGLGGYRLEAVETGDD